ncbi:MAG: hypothetical protein H7252_09015 [Cytophaga sp.]|nr:hypothetical protein [Undibacterium sp.]
MKYRQPITPENHLNNALRISDVIIFRCGSVANQKTGRKPSWALGLRATRQGVAKPF